VGINVSRKSTIVEGRWIGLGRSVEGRRIKAWVRRGQSASNVLVLGGMHGDEPKSVYVAQRLIDELVADSSTGKNVGWVVVPIVNPDGYERRRRRNARNVDLNRNFPTRNWKIGSPRSRMYGGPKPASEPETRLVIKLVERYRPACIITIHSISKRRFCNNYDGPGRAIARLMSRHNGYPVTANIGYPTPGSFGTWAGAERGIRTITLELPSHESAVRCWAANRAAILSVGRIGKA